MEQQKASRTQAEDVFTTIPRFDQSQSTMTDLYEPPNTVLPKHEEDQDPPQKIGFRQRIKHFTFAWFLSTMSTGGLALALAETPHKFRGSSIPIPIAHPHHSLTNTQASTPSA
jgi:hypothetical protein